MEKRAFGKTGMQVSVPGFSGAEIGHKGIDETTVERLLGSALDAGLNVANQEAIEHAIPDAQQKQMAVIAKRPIANVAWKTSHKPNNS